MTANFKEQYVHVCQPVASLVYLTPLRNTDESDESAIITNNVELYQQIADRINTLACVSEAFFDQFDISITLARSVAWSEAEGPIGEEWSNVTQVKVRFIHQAIPC
jgi:hypothetical protein